MTRHTFADSPRLAELLIRHHLGLIAPQAAARLSVIFATDPPDALERLARACDHLGVTGDQLAELAARADLERQHVEPSTREPVSAIRRNTAEGVPGDLTKPEMGDDLNKTQHFARGPEKPQEDRDAPR